MAATLGAKEIAAALGKPRKSGRGFACCCPAHDDKNPSLWIADGDRGGIGGKCHAGCSWEDVRSALEVRGLWPSGDRRGPGSKFRAQKANTNQNRVVAPIPDNAPPLTFEKNSQGEPSRLYGYRDADGRPIGYVARWERSGEKIIRPFVLVRTNSGALEWTSRALPEPRPLFRSEVLARRPDASVLLVEGEKAAETAAALLPDTVPCTWPGGANAVGKVDWSALAGRDVTLWPDNDDAGRRAMDKIAPLLKSIARSVRLVELPERLPPKWDLGDPVPDGVDVLALLAEAAPAASGLRQHVLSASELARLPIPRRDFIIAPIFVEGGLFMVYAERGLGKTWFALQASLAIAEGEDFFGFNVPRPQTVLFVDGEMSLAELQDRLRMLRGEAAERLLMLPSERLFLEDRPLNISSDEDQQRIIGVINDLDREGKRPALIVFDNLSSLSGGVDENDNSALDGLLRWLVGIKHRGIAVLLVHHAGKSGAQRGASRREDLLDTSIALQRKPKEKDEVDDASHDGAEFIVKFVKTRGKAPVPNEFLLQLDEAQDGRLDWLIESAPNVSAKDRTLRCIALYHPRTQKELAEHLKRSRGGISQHCSELRSSGLLGDDLKITQKGMARLLKVWPEMSGKIAVQDDLPI